MYKKKTLRHMQPVTRRYARILNDLDGVLRRLHNLTEEVARLELDSRALLTATRQDTKHANLDEFLQDQLQDDNGADLDKEITWEKVSTTHVVLDPQTGETEILSGKEDACTPTE